MNEPSETSLCDLPAQQSARPGDWIIGWALPAYLALIIFGALLLTFGGTRSGSELAPDRAVFAAVNAATLTGFPTDIGLESYSTQGWWTVVALTTISTLGALILGGLGVVRVIGLPYSDRQVILCSLFLIAVSAFGGSALLIAADYEPMTALLLSVGSLGNSGLAAGQVPALASPQLQLGLLPLAVVGGLGAVILLEVADRIRGTRCLSPHSQASLLLTALLYLGGTLATRALLDDGGTWISSATLTLNARTLGLPIEFAGGWPREVQWFAILLMVIGAASGGTAGGLKVTTLAVIGSGCHRLLHGRAPHRAFAIAVIWTTTYASLVFLTTLLLLIVQPQMPTDRLLFLAVSAVSNVGLAHDTLAMTGNGLFILSLAMLAGRVGSLLVLWWAASLTERSAHAVG